jgi:hypothetical protein
MQQSGAFVKVAHYTVTGNRARGHHDQINVHEMNYSASALLVHDTSSYTSKETSEILGVEACDVKTDDDMHQQAKEYSRTRY